MMGFVWVYRRFTYTHLHMSSKIWKRAQKSRDDQGPSQTKEITPAEKPGRSEWRKGTTRQESLNSGGSQIDLNEVLATFNCPNVPI